MSGTSIFYWQEKLAKTNPQIIRLAWDITAATTVSPRVQGLPALTTFTAISSQSTIDNFLGTTDEFTIAQFDATAMGADAFGCLVAMNGQAAAGVYMQAICYSGTGGATRVERSVAAGSLTASTLETAFAVGANGNMAFKIDFGNTPDFDGLTAGLIVVQLAYIAK